MSYDDAYIFTAIEILRITIIEFNNYRSQTSIQNLIIDDLKISKLSVEKVTQFDLIPTELRGLFNKMGDYFCWFVIDKAKVNVNKSLEKTTIDLSTSCWIYCLQRKMCMRKKSLQEILVWCEKYLDKLIYDEDDDEVIYILEIFDPLKYINTVLQQDYGTDVKFSNHFLDQLLFNENYKEEFYYPFLFLHCPNYTNIIHFALYAF